MKYQVEVFEVFSYVVEVEAESAQDAQGEAAELIAAGCYPNGEDFPSPEYSHTLDRDEWNVWEDLTT